MRPPTVLVSSAGRRVELLRGFRDAFEHLGTGGRVLATDSSWYSSAFHAADAGFLVPRVDSPDFIPHVLELCRDERVDLVVPTTDREMPCWVAGRERFAEIGTTVALSADGVVAVASDKQRTHGWLVANGFPTVAQSSPADVLADPTAWPFPLVVKPRLGSAGIGVAVVRDADELAVATRSDGFAAEMGTEVVVQTVARGIEHTIDVLADRAGRCVCAVPRRRIEVRAGEVSKAVTVRSPVLTDLAARLCAALPGAYGALNVQVFVGAEPDELAIIELNARFGGGFPLSLRAGADFPRWMLEELAGLPSTASPDGWHEGLVMLRYDAAIFVDEKEAPR